MTDRTELDLGGSILGDRLRDAGFSVSLGIDDERLDQLVELAPRSRLMTPRDYAERHGTRAMAEAWAQEHERTFYGLDDREGKLVAAVWFSLDLWMAAQKTSTMRAWDDMRREQWSTMRDAFMLLAHKHQEFDLGFRGDVWTQSDQSNHTEHKRFLAIGYHHSGGPDIPSHQARFIRPYSNLRDEDSTAA